MSITVALSSSLLVRSVRLGTMRQLDNTNNNLNKYRKPRGHTSRSRQDSTSFRWLKKSVLRKRGLRRWGRRRGLRKRLKRRLKKQLATLKKQYNSPKTASVRPYKPLLKSRSVRSVALLTYLMYKVRCLHQPSRLRRPATGVQPSYRVNISSATSSQ